MGAATVLSCQSQVVSGTVGNSVAVPVLWALGVRALGLPTALLSNHNARPRVAGIPLTGEHIDSMVDVMAANGDLSGVDVVLTGYMSPRTAPAVLRTVERVRQANRRARWVCDPVMGDMTPAGPRRYVPAETVDLLTGHAHDAEVLVPNVMELGELTGSRPGTPEEVAAAARGLISGRTELVVVTSVPLGDDLAVMAVDAEQALVTSSPRMDRHFNGAGDLTSAVLTAHLLGGSDLPDALGSTAAVVNRVLDDTAAAGSDDLVWSPERIGDVQPWKTEMFAPSAPRRVGRSS